MASESIIGTDTSLSSIIVDMEKFLNYRGDVPSEPILSIDPTDEFAYGKSFKAPIHNISFHKDGKFDEKEISYMFMKVCKLVYERYVEIYDGSLPITYHDIKPKFHTDFVFTLIEMSGFILEAKSEFINEESSCLLAQFENLIDYDRLVEIIRYSLCLNKEHYINAVKKYMAGEYEYDEIIDYKVKTIDETAPETIDETEERLRTFLRNPPLKSISEIVNEFCELVLLDEGDDLWRKPCFNNICKSVLNSDDHVIIKYLWAYKAITKMQLKKVEQEVTGTRKYYIFLTDRASIDHDIFDIIYPNNNRTSVVCDSLRFPKSLNLWFAKGFKATVKDLFQRNKFTGGFYNDSHYIALVTTNKIPWPIRPTVTRTFEYITYKSEAFLISCYNAFYSARHFVLFEQRPSDEFALLKRGRLNYYTSPIFQIDEFPRYVEVDDYDNYIIKLFDKPKLESNDYFEYSKINSTLRLNIYLTYALKDVKGKDMPQNYDYVLNLTIDGSRFDSIKMYSLEGYVCEGKTVRMDTFATGMTDKTGYTQLCFNDVEMKMVGENKVLYKEDRAHVFIYENDHYWRSRDIKVEGDVIYDTYPSKFLLAVDQRPRNLIMFLVWLKQFKATLDFIPPFIKEIIIHTDRGLVTWALFDTPENESMETRLINLFRQFIHMYSRNVEMIGTCCEDMVKDKTNVDMNEEYTAKEDALYERTYERALYTKKYKEDSSLKANNDKAGAIRKYYHERKNFYKRYKCALKKIADEVRTKL